MFYVLTIWDENNERHAYKFDCYDIAEARAYEEWDLGAEFVTITNSHTGDELLTIVDLLTSAIP